MADPKTTVKNEPQTALEEVNSADEDLAAELKKFMDDGGKLTELRNNTVAKNIDTLEQERRTSKGRITELVSKILDGKVGTVRCEGITATTRWLPATDVAFPRKGKISLSIQGE